ncbi:MAG: acylphosphatase [Thermodesulfobacteria bacterium]|nr:acylphosphatase [Thermodesulfobacteriota bacterium]
MAKKRVHVYISGRVQGVWFRAYTKEQADRLGITGWVRNLPDGRVEAVFEGDEDKIEEMIRWCHVGSPQAKVTHVEVIEEPYRGEFESFEIRY